MKIYMFYFRDNDDNRKLVPFLYAYTNDKSYAERFKEFRNMNKFLCVERDLDKDQYKEFNHQYPSQQLTKTKLMTKDNEFPTKKSFVEMICTWDEEKSVILESEDSVFMLFKDIMFNPSLFSMDIKSALFKIGFFTIYQYLYSNMYIFESLDGAEYMGIFNKDSIAGDFVRPVINMQDVKADQLAMFLYLYGGTIN